MIVETNILMKHQLTDASDCAICCRADFATMKIELHIECQPLISPHLLLLFLEGLHHHNTHFEQAGIVGALAITRRFAVSLHLITGTVFDVRAYEPFSAQVELEFFERQKQ